MGSASRSSDGQHFGIQVHVAAGRHIPAPAGGIRHDAAPQRSPLLGIALVGRDGAIQRCRVGQGGRGTGGGWCWGTEGGEGR